MLKQNKKNQHVVPASIIKKFCNDVSSVNNYVTNNICRFKLYKNKIIGSFAKKSAYKVIKNDFLKKDLFLIDIKNILKPDDKKFCEGILYGVNINEFRAAVSSYQITGFESKEFMQNYNKLNNLDDYEIKHLLEDSHCEHEANFGMITKDWDIHMGENLSDDEYLIVINFLSSNLLRPKSNYQKIEIKEPCYSVNGEIPLYDALNTMKFYNFILTHDYEKISLFDHLKTFNALNSLKHFEISKRNENIKRLFSYVNNNKKTILDRKNVLFVRNKTNIDFILGDNLVCEYDNTHPVFNHLKFIFGKCYIKTPKKIQIGVIRPDLLIIVTDAKIKNNFLELSKNNVKKINSLTVKMADEWLVIKSIGRRNKLIDINFFKSIEKEDYSSRYLKWFKLSLQGVILNNDGIGFNIINKKQFNKIKPLADIAFNFSIIKTVMQKMNSTHSYLKINNGKLIVSHNKSNLIAINEKNNFKIIICDNELINDIHKFGSDDFHIMNNIFFTMLDLKITFKNNAIFMESRFL